MYVICFYVPKKSAELVKTAMFSAGAGTVGNYSHCSFETEGRGQFLPMTGATPSLGSVNKLEFVDELKVEMVCAQAKLNDVIAALKLSHPYEEVAHHILKSVQL